MKRAALFVSPEPIGVSNHGSRVHITQLVDEARKHFEIIVFIWVKLHKHHTSICEMPNAENVICKTFEANFANKRTIRERVQRFLDKIFLKLWKLQNGHLRIFSQLSIGVLKLLPDNCYWRRLDWLYPPGLDNEIIALNKLYNFDTVVVEYVFLSKVLEIFPTSVNKILDTIDRFTDRHRKFLARGMIPIWHSFREEDEKRGLKRANIILAIQENEAEGFKRLGFSSVHTLGFLKSFQPKDITKIARGNILYVGSFNDSNVGSLRFFIEKIFPLILIEEPVCSLSVVGEVSSAFRNHDKKINFYGFVEDVSVYYEQANVVINPAIVGTGLKIKTVEALSYGRPVVTTTAGADGLEMWNGRALLIADSPREFADSVLQVIANKELFSNLRLGTEKVISSYQAANEKTLNSIFSKAAWF